MTYLRFHFCFNLPLMVVLGAISGQEPWVGEEGAAVAWVLLAVMVFTSPWDNLAAKWGIWGFPREKYSRKIGYLPVEEYAFFLAQSLNVILAIRALLFRFPSWVTGEEVVPTSATWVLLAASVFPLVLVGVQLRRWRQRAGARVNYLLHLGWFLPVIYMQWVLAPTLFWVHAGLLALVTGGFGVYYTLADLVAVRGGTWHFDEKQITGVKLAGVLPWEEIAFFFLTSLLVAQSYLLLLPANLR
jgi:lycopene cyclase domain-containing protein